MALAFGSLLKANGSAAKMGRETVSSGTSPFKEYASGWTDPMDGHVDASAFWSMLPEPAPGSSLPKINLGLDDEKLLIEFCRN